MGLVTQIHNTATAPSKPRVLVILNRYRPMIGGAERQCELLCENLSHQVHWVGILTHRYAAELPNTEMVNGLPVERLGAPVDKKRGLILLFYAELGWKIFQKRQFFDLVHCHTTGLTGLWVAAVCRLIRKPVLLKLTAEGELRNQVRPDLLVQNRTLALLKSGLRRIVAKLSVTSPLTHVVALTQGGGQEALACGVAHIHVIPNGVDAKKYQNISLRCIEKFPFVRFGYAGRLTEEKGTHLLAEAFDRLLAMNLRVHLHIAGSGDRQLQSSESKIKALINRWPHAVHHEGTVLDTVDFLSNLDIYISASTYEGLPNSVLEALAAGLPCVLSDIDAHRELAHLNPDASICFFKPSDLTSMLNTVLTLLENWPIARSKLSQDLDISNVSKLYLNLYLQMAKEHQWQMQ